MALKGVRILRLLAVTLLAGPVTLVAQPTIELLQRVFMIDYENQRGTSFSMDIDDREYWITARHILTGARSKPYGTFADKMVDVKLLNPGGNGEQWMSQRFAVLQPSADVDVVVLVPSSPILADVLPSPSATSVGLALGENCEFLGFAYGGGLEGKDRQGHLLVTVH
jgi:hypothetical protein